MANFLDGLLSGKNAFTQTTASFAQPAVGANVTVPVVFSGWTAVGMAVFLEVGGNYQVVSIPNDSSIQLKNLGSSGNAAVSASVPPGRMAPAGAPGADGTGGTSVPAPALVATSNVTLTGNVVVDGVATNTLVAGSYVLATEQAAPANNGPWLINNVGAWSRPTWYDSDAEIAALRGITTGAVLGGNLAGTVWFQSSGLTLAGAKTWTKLSTPSLLQDRLGTTLPAQLLTQQKGAAILRDPTNGRNSIDHDRVDIREYGGNPNGVQQTTYTSVAGNANIDLVSAKTYAVGQWLMLHQSGAAHGMSAPGTPIMAVQGKPGSRTVKVKWVAATDHHGYTAASVATTVTTANVDANTVMSTTIAGTAMVRPTAGGSINQQVADSSIFTVGTFATVVGDFPQCYFVTAVPDATHVTLKYLGDGGLGPRTFTIGTAIASYQYTEAWCADVPCADKYICYVQFDNTGNYNYYGQIIAHPMPAGVGSTGYYHPTSIRITTSVPPTPPPGIPPTAPSASVPNALRTKITALSGVTATVSPAPTTSATAQVCEICNKIPFEDACASDPVHSVELRLAKGTYYCAGNVDQRNPTLIVGSDAGLQAVGSKLLFRDGCGYATFQTRTARAWQPGVRYRGGDRVTTDSVINVTGTWVLTTAGNGQTWAVSTTTPPTWNTTLFTTTTDANGNVWTYNNIGLTSTGAKHKHIGLGATGTTAPAQRCMQVSDLRWDPTGGPRVAVEFVAGTAYGTGAWVVPEQSKATGKVYQCLAGGTAGAGPASWGRVNGGTTSDGTLNWQCFDLGWLQGAMIEQFSGSAFSRCQIDTCHGAGIAIEGTVGLTGGNADKADHYDWDIRNVTGSLIFARGPDANLVTIARGEYQPFTANPLTISSPYQALQLFAVQDASFYGMAVLDPFSQGYIGFQNARSGSAQGQGRIVNPYIENGGSYAGMVDYNQPAAVGPGGNYGPVRDGATAPRKSGPSRGNIAQCSSTPELITDDAATMQSDYSSASKEWLLYNGDTNQQVPTRFMAQLNFGAYNTTSGKQTLTQMASTAFPVVYIDHFGAHGRGIVFPGGVTSLIEGMPNVQESHVQLRFVNAVPTVGTFAVGDILYWCGDASRLDIRPTAKGGLSSTPWAASTIYTNGAIVGQSGKTFILINSKGTSSASLPAAFAATAVGGYVIEGVGDGCHWYCWSSTSPGLRATPNWAAAPIALADGNYQAGSGLLLSAGPVRDLAAATANRTIDLLTTGVIAGDGFELRNNNDVAFTWTINSGSGGSAAIVLPVNTPCKVRLVYSGSAWAVDSFQLISASPRLNPIRKVAGTTDSPTAADNGTVIEADNAALTTFTLNSMPAGTTIPFDGVGAGGYTFANGTATIATALASNGAAAQHQGRLAYWRTPTSVRIT